jgi:geranylgeranyl diphosphate synthase type II
MAAGISMDLFQELQPLREAVDGGLDRFSAECEGCPRRLAEAIRYSLLAPGKRLRPLLCLLACEAVGGSWRPALPAACAVEMIHVYSLIHDDLPAMDNDTLRRGRATCHIEFDEATAILAGDSLQMLAMQTLTQEMPASAAVRCVQILAAAAGRGYLVGGQADDLAAEGRFGPLAYHGLTPVDFLKSIHRRKTSALIEASLQLGGVAGEASMDHLKCLSIYGQAIGLAFQIVDDCLDVESTAEQLGKNTRKDSSLGKLTYPGLLGLEESRRLAAQLSSEACTAIAVFKERGERLTRLAQFVVERKV